MAVALEHVSKVLRGRSVLTDITLSLSPCSIVGLEGDNGSGKTMLLRVIAGLVKPSEGTVSIGGRKLWGEIDFPPSIGVLIENPAFLELKTGFDNLKLLARIKRIIDENGIREVLEEVGLGDVTTQYRAFSLGMKQRLGIAAAIMESPKLILLDEPTNALDSEGVNMVERVVAKHRNRGACIVVASHDAAFLNRVSDVVLRLQDGRIVNRESGIGRIEKEIGSYQ